MIVCVPTFPAVAKINSYGDSVSLPAKSPSIKNSTFFTASLSLASALRVIDTPSVNSALFAGKVMLTVGEVESGSVELSSSEQDQKTSPANVNAANKKNHFFISIPPFFVSFEIK